MGNKINYNQPCKYTECHCRGYIYDNEKTLTADGRASKLKYAGKVVFHSLTLWVGHMASTDNRCDCGHRKDDHHNTLDSKTP